MREFSDRSFAIGSNDTLRLRPTFRQETLGVKVSISIVAANRVLTGNGFYLSPDLCNKRVSCPGHCCDFPVALRSTLPLPFPTEICLRAPFGTGVKELPVHLNISSLLFTPQTVPCLNQPTYFSSPAICRQPLPVQVKIWFLALTPQIFFEFPTEICLRAPFETGVKELPVHLNISSFLFTPQMYHLNQPIHTSALPLSVANHYRSK